ncbi:mandelate racemase/muconate lactonizing enzyme family protein [Microbacterium sp. NPDC087665]|uniref:mandelate racemase/muconate lactonizing enzyme family protein n=1 Tax=Microbacterium sp. NPDC087665 TaxID=3364194 RepID=UPI0037FD1A06
MSVIERLRVLRVASPLVRPFVTAVRRTDQIDVVLVEATDADGRTGWGEAATSWRVTGESAQSVAAVAAGPLGDVVIGRDAGDPVLASDIARAVWGNAAARSAVECALADLDAQARAIPVAQMFAAEAAPSRIRTDMTLSAADPAELADRAAEHVAAGFRCLKIKASAAHDTVAGLHAVRAAIGSEVSLRIDANQAWDAETAIRIIRAAEDRGFDVELVEQPVAAHDLDALARVTAAVGTPIMADEAVRTARDVRAIAERGAADLVNIKLAKTGGLAEAAVAAGAAREAGLGVVFGCMMEAHVGVTAAAHLAAAFAPDVVHDLDAALWLRRSPVVGGIRSTGDTLELGTESGFGIHGLAPGAAAGVLADVHSRGAVHA